jgi:hypothetical protein
MSCFGCAVKCSDLSDTLYWFLNSGFESRLVFSDFLYFLFLLFLFFYNFVNPKKNCFDYFNKFLISFYKRSLMICFRFSIDFPVFELEIFVDDFSIFKVFSVKNWNLFYAQFGLEVLKLGLMIQKSNIIS